MSEQLSLFDDNDSDSSVPWCADCCTPMMPSYGKPQLRKGRPPMYPWYCMRHGTIYHSKKPPKRS